MDGMALTEDIFFFARGAEFFRMPVTEIVRRKNHWMVQSTEFKTIEKVLQNTRPIVGPPPCIWRPERLVSGSHPAAFTPC